MCRAWSLLCLALLACQSTRGEEHLRRELNFFVPYIDIEAEEKAVRAVLAQRKLVVEETVRRPDFVALAASTLDGSKSAVRVISRRGVVLGEDGDTQDYFAKAAVGLSAVEWLGGQDQTLIGVRERARGQGVACLQLFHVAPDGRIGAVPVHLESFGDRACLHSLQPRTGRDYTATVAWPALSPLGSPLLQVDVAPPSARLDQPEGAPLDLRVIPGGEWVQRETERLATPLPGQANFSLQHARGVEQAALALAIGKNVDAQLGAYRSALGRVPPGSPEAHVMADTTDHIERGWLDQVAAPDETLVEADAGALIDPDSVVIEPTP